MKKRFLSKCLVFLSCIMLLYPVSSFAAPDDNIVEDNVVVTQDIQKTEDEELSEDIQENTTNNAKQIEDNSEVSITEDTSGIIGPDGNQYSGKVIVNFAANEDGETSLLPNTTFNIYLRSASGSSNNKEIILEAVNNYTAAVEIPVDLYFISWDAYVNGNATSDADLILKQDDGELINLENSTVYILKPAQNIEFIRTGPVKVQNESPEEEDVPETKAADFFLNLLKQNIVFIVLFLGLGIFLLVYRLKQNKYR